MTIKRYGRLLYWVQSETRRSKWHLVDMEPSPDFEWPWVCNCEDYQLQGARPCKHIRRLFWILWSEARDMIEDDIKKHNEALAHRYLRDVLGTPILESWQVEQMEDEARAHCPAESLINKPPNDNPQCYPDNIRELAATILEQHNATAKPIKKRTKR